MDDASYRSRIVVLALGRVGSLAATAARSAADMKNACLGLDVSFGIGSFSWVDADVASAMTSAVAIAMILMLTSGALIAHKSVQISRSVDYRLLLIFEGRRFERID